VKWKEACMRNEPSPVAGGKKNLSREENGKIERLYQRGKKGIFQFDD